MSTRAKIWIVSVVALFIVAIGGAWIYLHQHLGDGVGQARSLYEEHAQALRQRQWIRPSSDQEELEDGAAADYYKEAWEACDLPDQFGSEAGDSINSAVVALLPPEQRGTGVELTEPDGDISAVCRKAGVSSADDLASAQLNDAACQLILDCDGALDLLEQGARQKDARSPFYVFDDWSAGANGQFRSALPFIHLGNLFLLRAHFQTTISGSSAPSWRAALTVMRFGRDLGNGAGLLPTMVGAAIEENAAGLLGTHLHDPDLESDQVAEITLRLQLHARAPVDIRSIFEAEMLYTMGSLLAAVGEDIDAPPASLDVTTRGGADKALMEDALGDLADYWQEIFAVLPRPLPSRLRRYQELAADMSDRLNPLSSIIPNYGEHDVQLTLLDARTRLLLLGFAIRQLAERSGNEQLEMDLALITRHAWPGADRLIDPLTDRPYGIDDDLVLHSRARANGPLSDQLSDREKAALQLDVSSWLE